MAACPMAGGSIHGGLRGGAPAGNT